MTAAARAELRDAATHAAEVAADCRRLTEQLHAVREQAEQQPRRLAASLAAAGANPRKD